MTFAIELKILANYYEEQGDYQRALELHSRALTACQDSSAANSQELATYIYDLALVELALDRGGEARKLLSRLVEIVPADHELVREIETALREQEPVSNAA